MAYKRGTRDQLTFLPDSIDQYVLEDDPVRAYDAFVDVLSIEALGITLDEHAVGNSSYDPVAMLKILVYGYSYGWRSSRKLERALHHNLSFIWLAGGLKPDHKTISNFRKKHQRSLKKVLTQCVRMCIKLKLVEGNTLFVDGSKFRANAGNRETRSAEGWERYRKKVEQRIDALFLECQNADDQEQESLVKMKKELKSKQKLRDKITDVLQEIQEDQKNINGTDRDCKMMKGRQGSHPGYNGQLVTDEANGMIVSAEAITSGNDLNALGKQIENAEQVLDKKVSNVCADSGYSSVDDLKPLLDQGKTVIVPNSKQAQKNPKENSFDKDAFTYNPETNTYTCPAGQELRRYGKKPKENKLEYKITKASVCTACEHFGTCTKAKRGRQIYRLINEEAKDELAQNYESEQGQKLYEKRKIRAELPFGHFKRNLGAGSFLLRKIEGANAELNLFATCFNIARMITLAGGVQEIIKDLRSAA